MIKSKLTFRYSLMWKNTSQCKLVQTDNLS